MIRIEFTSKSQWGDITLPEDKALSFIKSISEYHSYFQIRREKDKDELSVKTTKIS